MSRSRDYVGDIPVEMAERILRKKREKARRILEEKRVIETSEPGIYLIANGKGNNYRVDLAKQSCTCLDNEYRKGQCKHLIAAEMKDVETKQEIWRSLKPGLQLIANGSSTNADTSRWHRYEKIILGMN